MKAIIDMDSMVYRAFPGRQSAGGPSRVFTAAEDDEYIASAWETFKRRVNEVQTFTFSDSFKGAIGGKDNFRDQMFPDYKAHRRTQDKSEQKELVRSVCEMAIAEGLATPADGREADDLVRIWAEEARAANEDFVICRIDKDLECIPGIHCLMHDSQALVIKHISEKHALRHYYAQLICGDSGDYIEGVPGIGPQGAASTLLRCFDVPQMRRAVLHAYKNHFGEEWYERLTFNGRLIHIQTTLDDVFDPLDWPEASAFL